MKVISNILCFDSGIPVKFRKSPNTGGVLIPKYLIIHYDASETAEGAIKWLTTKRPKDNVSAHLHISRSGEVVQMVPFNVVAWHAGASEWKGLKGMNNYSLGIELQNTGTQEYTEVQIKALTEASKAMVEAYQLLDVVGHYDVSPTRKIDPGKQFPMVELRRSIFGNTILKTVTADMLNLRSGAGQDFSIVTQLSKGTRVNVLSEKDNWSEVFICGQNVRGWVSTKFIH